MSLREDLMLQRYHEKNGTLVAFLRGETGPTPVELWHDEHKDTRAIGPQPAVLRVADLGGPLFLPEEIDLIIQRATEENGQ